MALQQTTEETLRTRDEIGRLGEGNRRTGEEVARLGKAIYERDIRAQVEADHQNEFVAIDVESGCWVVAEKELAASRRLREVQPDAYDVWMMRVGHATTHYIGYSPPKRAE